MTHQARCVAGDSQNSHHAMDSKRMLAAKQAFTPPNG